jgi:Ribosomal protein S12/S23
MRWIYLSEFSVKFLGRPNNRLGFWVLSCDWPLLITTVARWALCSGSGSSLPLKSPTMGKGKPAGLNAARKLRIHRRENRWADDHYRKRALGTAWKMSPLKGASHGKGIVLEKIGIEAKQPNSAVRKCVRVQLIKNGKKYQTAKWLLVEQVLIVG